MDERRRYRKMILENIEYEIIATPFNKKQIDEMVEIMLDTIFSSKEGRSFRALYTSTSLL